MTGQLRKSENKLIGGVCGGLGEYFGIDPTIVRLVFVALALAGGHMILVYILGWIIIPKPNAGQVSVETAGAGDEVIETSGSRRKWLGIILVIVGAGFLLDNFSLMYCTGFSTFWPLLLIAGGVVILLRVFSNKEESYEIE